MLKKQGITVEMNEKKKRKLSSVMLKQFNKCNKYLCNGGAEGNSDLK